ncbi:MAG: hypothetical protein ABUS48_06135 [Pseudomonadota bacterium]
MRPNFIRQSAAFFKAAPQLATMRRLDDTRAARQPKLRWRPEEREAAKKAAE